MTLSNIAKTLGMTVQELSLRMGYSRQALYTYCFKDKRRAEAAIASLRTMNADMYQQERETAMHRFQARSRAIKALEKKILNGGDA